MALTRVCCQTENNHGSARGTISLQTKSKPQEPDELEVEDKKSTSLSIKWIQGFDGGSDQTFKIQYAKRGLPIEQNERRLLSSRLQNMLRYNISGLDPGTCYSIRVGSFNKIFQDPVFTDTVEGCTLSDPNYKVREKVYSIATNNSTFSNSKIPKDDRKYIHKSTSFIITVAGCVFGFVIFIINILTFVICYKRKQEKSRKRRQDKEEQSASERQTNTFSKFESSLMENNLYDGSILTTTDSCCMADGRDKEEEIPMLVYPKSICPLHFTSNDQYSNPLIIQDHYLHANMSCSPINDKDENSCYGCSSMELPLSNVILSNQYIPFPIIQSPYNTLFSAAYNHSPGNSIISGQNPPKDSSSILSSCSIIPLSSHINSEMTSPLQSRFINQGISDPRSSPPSPIFVRRVPSHRGND